jgi:outer membrane protein assembly factor BamB
MKLIRRAWVLTAGLLIVALAMGQGEALAAAEQAPAWKVELDDPVDFNEFLENGKYLFFQSGKQAWLYESGTGRQVYALTVEKYEKKGVHTLIGNRYLASSGKALACYDAITGKMSWKKEYAKIAQNDYKSYEFIANTAVFRFDDMELAINLETGDELWRAEINYNGKLVDKGSYNYKVLSQTGKLLVIERGDKLALFDVATGKKTLTIDKVAVNEDLIKGKHPWLAVSTDDRYATVVMEKGVLVVDAAESKALANLPLAINGDYDVLFPMPKGISVFGKEKLVTVTYEGAKVTEVAFPIKEVRTLQRYAVEGKEILLISAKNRIAAIDMNGGSKLWQTDIHSDENRAGFSRSGFVHRYLRQDGTDAILSYVEAGNYSRTSPGSWVFALRINLLTGAVTYKTLTGIAKAAISDIGRAAGKVAGSLVDAVRGSGAGEGITRTFGYEKVGFEYETLDHNGKLVYVFRNKVALVNPVTNEEPGEGLCALDPVSGKVAYQEYFALLFNDSWSKSAQFITEHAPAPLVENGIMYLAGNGRVIAFDLNAGKRLWTVEKELNKGYPTDIAVIDGAVYVKLGKDPVAASLEKDQVKVNSPWEQEPHGFAAIEAGSGKFLWKHDLKNDPGILLPRFSIRNYYNAATKQLYFADEEYLYALGLRPDGGKIDWKLDLDKAKLGEMEKKKIFSINQTFLGTVPRTTSTTHGLGGGATLTTSQTTGGLSDEGARKFIEDAEGAEAMTTYTSWGNIWGVTAKRCLRILFDKENILVIGSDGIGMVDAAKGTAKWVAEWDYDQQAVQYIPKVMNGKLVYCVDRNMVALDLATGKKLWETKEAKAPKFFAAPDQTFLFSIDKDIIKGYQL